MDGTGGVMLSDRGDREDKEERPMSKGLINRQRSKAQEQIKPMRASPGPNSRALTIQRRVGEKVL